LPPIFPDQEEEIDTYSAQLDDVEETNETVVAVPAVVVVVEAVVVVVADVVGELEHWTL